MVLNGLILLNPTFPILILFQATLFMQNSPLLSFSIVHSFPMSVLHTRCIFFRISSFSIRYLPLRHVPFVCPSVTTSFRLWYLTALVLWGCADRRGRRDMVFWKEWIRGRARGHVTFYR
ncbi:hypothetical protein M405DRAFT_388459 [Rhizopogon salebrosus TDB-379]|nr:hypothetical protein M405DRAFT_388459 [Rhizopogon salebrosus TDB-379]